MLTAGRESTPANHVLRVKEATATVTGTKLAEPWLARFAIEW